MSPSYKYCPCYCEENIWHLCAEPAFEDCDARVVFISNPWRQVALWGQRSAEAAHLPVVWDYHVILLARASHGWAVFDLDTALGWPLPADTYLDQTFPRPDLVPAIHAPRFRLLSAVDYRRELRTDRRHMLLAAGGYLSPPPAWPQIGQGSNLSRFIDMDDDFLGEVDDFCGLRHWLSSPPS